MTGEVWFYCQYAKNQPMVCIEICAANCKVPKRFGRCKYYEENCGESCSIEDVGETHDEPDKNRGEDKQDSERDAERIGGGCE